MYIKRSYIAPRDNILEVWALLAPYISIVAHFCGKVKHFIENEQFCAIIANFRQIKLIPLIFRHLKLAFNPLLRYNLKKSFRLSVIAVSRKPIIIIS